MRLLNGSAGWLRAVASVAAAAWALSGVGCQPDRSRLNAPPQGHTSRPHELQDDYVSMVDNAMLADMSMSPVHFVPHSVELNALGVRRLKRYASLMKVYGGKLCYDGADDTEEMADGRIGRIGEFLVAAGVPANSFTVERGLAGGAGMDAKEASRIREATRFCPKKEAAGQPEKPSGAGQMAGAPPSSP